MIDRNRLDRSSLARLALLALATGSALILAVACAKGGGGAPVAASGPRAAPGPVNENARQEYDAEGNPLPPRREEREIERRTLPGANAGGRRDQGGADPSRRDVEGPGGPPAGGDAQGDGRGPRPIVRFEAPGFNPFSLNNGQLFSGSNVARGIRPSIYTGWENRRMYYSQAGRDDLLRTLLTAVRQHWGEQRFEANRAFAETIETTRLIVSSNQAAGAVFELAVRVRGTRRLAILRGQLTEQRVGQGAEIDGFEGLRATVQCLDANSGCRVALVRLTNAHNYAAYFITRRYQAQVRPTSPRRLEGAQENQAYNRVMELFHRAGQQGEFDRLIDAEVTFTEVAGGFSSFSFGARVAVSEPHFAPGSPQALGMEGFLLKDLNSDIVGLAGRSAEDLASLGSRADVRSALSDSIRMGYLTRNDGRGNIEIRWSVGSPDGSGRADLATFVIATGQPAVSREVSL